MDENLQRQQEEIEVLNSIYEENIVLESESRVSIVARADAGQAADLSVSMCPAYPGSSPPSYQLSAPFLTSEEKQEISNSFDQLYSENMGESIVFIWVEHLRSFLQNRPSITSENCKTSTHDTVFDDQPVPDEIILLSQALEKSRISHNCPEIVTGDVIEDRKSVFQGHTAMVKSLDDVKMVISKLYENKKIAGATHNMYAYRIFCPEKLSWLSDCEDDGEDAAGGRMLHLLDILDVTDRLVVVTRWYGGVKLGPDRFKLINNAARKVLMLADPSLSQEDLKIKKKKGK